MRFPGGNLSNNYFWDGNIPSSVKADNNYNPISGTDNVWRLGVDDFLDLCDSLGNKPVICVNASYARYGNGGSPLAEAAHYAADFVRYVNKTKGKNVKYWEIGNENYGSWQAGYLVNNDTIDGAKYAEIVKVFADSMKAADSTIKVGAVAVEEDAEKGSGHNWWNKKMIPLCIEKVDFWITHQYFVFDKNDWNNITVDEILNSTHLVGESIENVYSSVEKYTSYPRDYLPVAMTEYNLRGGTKEVAQVAALFIAECIGEFIKNKYGMVMLWDIQNGTKSATSDGPGGDHGFYSWNDPVLPNGTPRPSFFTYYYLQKVLGNNSSNVHVVGDSLIAYGSVDDSGKNGLVIINQSDSVKKISVQPSDNSLGNYYWYSLHADLKTDKKFKINNEQNNSYSEGGPDNYESIPPFSLSLVTNANISLQPNSVNFIVFEPSMVTKTSSLQLLNVDAIFPNPSQGLIYWNQHSTYQIIDQQGKIVLRGYGNKVNLESFPDGTYQVIRNQTVSTITKAN